MIRLRVALAAAALGAVTGAPSPAPGAPAPQFRDRVFQGAVARPSAARSALQAKTYTTPDGLRVEVLVSSGVPNPDGVAREIVGFLATRLHGAELGRLRVFIGTPGEIQRACGGDERVLACYSAGERRMYVPDRDPGAGTPFNRGYAITHEYGHHIAAFRSNAPFPALNYGAKYWSSYEFVCAGARAGRYFPGNQGEHYLDDPGEAFADAYAHLHYPAVHWQFNASLAPDAGAFAALRRDVLNPWRGPRRKVVRGALTAARRSGTASVAITLDGTLDVRLRGPRGADFDVAAYNAGRLLSRTRVRGSRDRLRSTLCREEGTRVARVQVRVIRRAGAGRYTLTVLYP